MAGPDIDSLTDAVDTTYADDPSDASVQLHQQDHDILRNLQRATPVETQAGTSYTLVLADAGKVIESTSGSATTFTVPPNSSVAFPVGTIVAVCQAGAGTLSVAAGSGVTVNSRGSLTDLAGQWAEATLRQRSADVWVLTGDLT